MIKLFWNTHNQAISQSEDKRKIKKEETEQAWGIYHKQSSYKWICKILKKVEYQLIENEKDIEKGDVLIIVDSSVEKKNDLYKKLNLICSKVFLFHLGDEFGAQNLNLIYGNCNYVWRNFCSNEYFNNNNIKCLPLGYKSGIVHKKTPHKKYKWTFTGNPHKSSRHDLIFQLSDVKPFFFHKTEKFNVKIISVDEMSKVLSSTEFMPCPNGFFHPETYRLYEALECECIPIVEKAYDYYDRLFPNNPFIKVEKWIEAKKIITSFGNDDVKEKREECKKWWITEKEKIENFVKNKITS